MIALVVSLPLYPPATGIAETSAQATSYLQVRRPRSRLLGKSVNPLADLVAALASAVVAASCGDGQDPTGSQSDGAHDNPEVTVYYGLNESHSRDWAQVASDGSLGITYFQRSADSGEGVLLYKTIHADGSEAVETVTTGLHLEVSVLLYDANSSPHIFVAKSDESDQTIEHYHKNSRQQWSVETIVHFSGEGGKAIYELSADAGPDSAFHLLILKTRSPVDSDDFMEAWRDSHLYHLSNTTGIWEKELVANYDMAYTYDMYIKSSSRQDIVVDEDGVVHVVFSEQIAGETDPSRLRYANNLSGGWEVETALDYDAGTVDDAGWFPSLALDSNGVPYVSCMYVDRVPTHSATSANLMLLRRQGFGDWHSEAVAENDDGYYGSDGRDYTGGLSHLVIDSRDSLRVVFSDVASTHWPGTQRLNVGNIRYGSRTHGAWTFNTIHRQPLPTDYFIATEMHGMCLLVAEGTGTIWVVGQELVLSSEHDYSSNLVVFSWQESR